MKKRPLATERAELFEKVLNMYTKKVIFKDRPCGAHTISIVELTDLKSALDSYSDEGEIKGLIDFFLEGAEKYIKGFNLCDTNIGFDEDDRTIGG